MDTEGVRREGGKKGKRNVRTVEPGAPLYYGAQTTSKQLNVVLTIYVITVIPRRFPSWVYDVVSCRIQRCNMFPHGRTQDAESVWPEVDNIEDATR